MLCATRVADIQEQKEERFSCGTPHSGFQVLEGESRRATIADLSLMIPDISPGSVLAFPVQRIPEALPGIGAPLVEGNIAVVYQDSVGVRTDP
jgi:hypothetical protein